LLLWDVRRIGTDDSRRFLSGFSGFLFEPLLPPRRTRRGIMSRDFRTAVTDDRVYVFDGAMGTMLYTRGVYINKCYDELNISNPDLVAGIHRDYAKAGCDIIETNTYGANRVKLAG
jgi:homocysteine S-methyltransferase